jgi:transcriptional antiterminator RfaH
MPILMNEPSIYPSDLLAVPHPPDTRWWVLYVKARAEKALARSLLLRQSAFFLPVYENLWKTRNRFRRSYLPLFPGYLFLHGTEENRVQALATNRVSRCIEVNDQEQLRDDLIRVHRLIQSGEPLTPEDRLQPGLAVEVVCGCLEGLQGTLVRRGKDTCLVVEVRLLNRGVSVQLEQYMVRALNGTPGLARHMTC